MESSLDHSIRLSFALFLWGSNVAAETGSLYRPTGPSAPVVVRRAGVVDAVASPSLFVGARTDGLFAPLPDAAIDAPPGLSGTTQTAQLLSLIARAEAGSAGYDAVQYGARIRPTKPPTQMTLGEIYRWIADTPGQPHAIGRYQFIPSTLREVAATAGIGPEHRFSPAVQDRLAHVLLDRAGLNAFETGQMSRRTFMRNLARIWAGLPLPSGKSYYEGYAGNSATMSWAAFETGMGQIWPASSERPGS